MSILLAQLFGLYLMIVSVAVFIRRREIAAMAPDFFKDRAFVFFSGALLLIMGLLVVLNHNIWEMNYRGVITLFGWLTVVKGVARLFWPDQIKSFGVKAINSQWYAPLLVVFFLVGAWLAYTGFLAP